ncbi:type VI secretion system contractile sheath small subunit [Rubrivivax gelatinosus]|uniref:Type VI secretion system protein ImpB n=1 Tax=Rubrivivax gelatinosus TaxID=28068 RepID=A0A4R2MTU4_RUBGE|nr:type VI secretion system contractile sheath small subunit [Rubrivivax gelatinosus]MBK1687551.1 type VI secretion system-associated protein [Rubrivivax gelatinosus]TCP02923.1 type VI secretion system protein ImpB [Rubrivivax gelatinosus]
MPRYDSIQSRLETVRPPRVRLTYDVQVGDAIEHKELPFVVGVLGDFSGADGGTAAERPRLKDRRFVPVDVDNFDEVLRGIAPSLRLRVADRLSAQVGGPGGELGVELRFERLEDFRPESVVRQVEPLRRLLEARTRLADLRNKMAGNERLEELLVHALREPATLVAIGHDAPAASE